MSINRDSSGSRSPFPVRSDDCDYSGLNITSTFLRSSTALSYPFMNGTNISAFPLTSCVQKRLVRRRWTANWYNFLGPFRRVRGACDDRQCARVWLSLRRPPVSFTEAALVAASGVTLSQLRDAAARIAAFYNARGYFLAQAYVPAEDITGRNVTIAVVDRRAAGPAAADRLRRLRRDPLRPRSLVRIAGRDHLQRLYAGRRQCEPTRRVRGPHRLELADSSASGRPTGANNPERTCRLPLRTAE
jgi:hypothetical protein